MEYVDVDHSAWFVKIGWEWWGKWGGIQVEELKPKLIKKVVEQETK